MGIFDAMRRVHAINRVSQTAGRIGASARNGFNMARSLGGEARRRFIPGEQERVGEREKFFRRRVDEQVFEDRNARNIYNENVKREQERIFEHLLKVHGISGSVEISRARRNKRLLGMVKVIHEIFGAKLNEMEVAQIDHVLQKNLHPSAEFFNSSPELQRAVEIIGNGSPKGSVEQAFNVLTQASMDILQNDEVSQRIMQSHGLM
ncbi:MAG: hypothetical protein WC915_02205 [archaeon]